MTFEIHYNAWPLQALSNYRSALIYYFRWQGVWYGSMALVTAKELLKATLGHDVISFNPSSFDTSETEASKG